MRWPPNKAWTSSSSIQGYRHFEVTEYGGKGDERWVVLAAVLDKEINLISEELKNTGKPEDIVKKISIGKINKFKEDNGLLTQPWVMEPKKKVKDILKEISIKDLKIKDFYRLKIGE